MVHRHGEDKDGKGDEPDVVEAVPERLVARVVEARHAGGGGDGGDGEPDPAECRGAHLPQQHGHRGDGDEGGDQDHHRGHTEGIEVVEDADEPGITRHLGRVAGEGEGRQR